MTRPRKQIQDLKMLQINIRVTLEEQLQIEEYSKSYGLSVTQFIRIRSLKKQLPKNSIPSINRELFIQLCRIGNNLNQLTKKANQNHPDVKGLYLELLELNTKVNEIKTIFLL
jgi:hypothetical protein